METKKPDAASPGIADNVDASDVPDLHGVNFWFKAARKRPA
jgi:hypothetical protein